MISEFTVIKTEKIGENVVIHPFVTIQEDVTIGNHVIIHPNVVIESGVVVGDNTEIFPGTYLGKKPKGAGITARQPKFLEQLFIGENCLIGPQAVIYYDVAIGDNCLIGDSASIREKVVIENKCIISRGVTINYNVKIGERTKIMDLSHITGNCEIENDVFISVNVSTTNDNAMGTLGYNEIEVQGPKIRNHVKIGAGANILPGIEIGENAVVAAGAVVNKNVLPHTMVAGMPARLVKSLSKQ